MPRSFILRRTALLDRRLLQRDILACVYAEFGAELVCAGCAVLW